MNKREWKYLRKQYMHRKGYFSYSFRQFNYTAFKLGVVGFNEEGKSNFAMMIPQEPYKEYVYVPPYKTLSERRFILPVSLVSTSNVRRGSNVYEQQNGVTIITSRTI